MQNKHAGLLTNKVRTYLEQPSRPRISLPAGACDSHVHVFGPAARFAYSKARQFTPVDAPKEQLFALHRHLGITRCVIVQSVLHGLDNRVVADAIEAGAGRYLGVALVAADIPEHDLERLAQQGFRGVRFHFMRHISSNASMAEVLALTPRLAAFNMHLQVHCESMLIHELGEALAKSTVPVVIDHIGRVDARQGVQHPDFRALLACLGNPRFWVKVSGIDRIDAVHGPGDGYRHGVALARLLLERFPERCLWGTDWPHPNHTHIPDDGTLVDALVRIAPDAAHLERLLVSNPASFYRFEP